MFQARGDGHAIGLGGHHLPSRGYRCFNFLEVAVVVVLVEGKQREERERRKRGERETYLGAPTEVELPDDPVVPQGAV